MIETMASIPPIPNLTLDFSIVLGIEICKSSDSVTSNEFISTV